MVSSAFSIRESSILANLREEENGRLGSGDNGIEGRLRAMWKNTVPWMDFRHFVVCWLSIFYTVI